MAELNETPSGMRIHIGFFGRTNSGKSSLINALTGQDVSIVSPEPGTTTDPVYKAIELAPIGPCLLIDTPGFEDETVLGSVRMERTMQVAAMCDVAVWVIGDGSSGENSDSTDDTEQRLLAMFEESHVPVVKYISGDEIDALRDSIIKTVKSIPEPKILGDSVQPGDLVMLVMPQDKQAPKGRLILPQVTTLRELLDRHARTMCVCPEEMESALSSLREPPAMIITDSQVFDYVFERTPKESRLTSFSVLYAALKGDVAVFIAGARAIDDLKPGDRILVAESCSHAPLEEDIGRVKLPRLLSQRVGGKIETEIVAGKGFPEDLTTYGLILQCGGCMTNRRQILSRISRAQSQGVPITNYGIAIAYLKGILDRIQTES